MNANTEFAIVRAAAALVAPGADPIIENLELVQDMAESAAAYMASEDSEPMAVEVSAVRGFLSGSIEACNDAPETAEGFAVYVRNPLAFHIEDFDANDGNGGNWPLREAHGAAFRYAGALADHLGCGVVTSLSAGPDSWPSRFVVEAQRDALAGEREMIGADDAGTHFIGCEEHEATQWALLKLDVSPEGAPIAGTGDLIEDYPRRADAEAARDALERGQPLPDPIWPAPIGVDITAERLTLAGFAIEGGGAGCAFMVRAVNHPSTLHRSAIIIATDRDGSDLPRADSWRLGVYRAADWEEGGQPLATLESVPGAVIEASASAAAVMARGLIFGGAHA